MRGDDKFRADVVLQEKREQNVSPLRTRRIIAHHSLLRRETVRPTIKINFITNGRRKTICLSKVFATCVQYVFESV